MLVLYRVSADCGLYYGQLGGQWQWEWGAVKILLRKFYWSEKFDGEEFKVCLIYILFHHLEGLGRCCHTSNERKSYEQQALTMTGDMRVTHASNDRA